MHSMQMKLLLNELFLLIIDTLRPNDLIVCSIVVIYSLICRQMI